MSADYRRVQIYLRKEGAATALSHVEFMRTLETAILESGLPVWMTGGEEPRVKLSLPTALPQGMESRIEPVEFRVRNDVTVRRILEAVEPGLPDGVALGGADALYPGEKWAVESTEYEVAPAGGGLPEPEELARFLARDRIPYEKRGREADLRPFLVDLSRRGGVLRVRIAWTDRGTARPADVLTALGLKPEDFRIAKVGMVFRTSLHEEIVKPDDTQDPDQRPRAG